MSSLLHQLARYGDITWLSYYFADFIARQSQTDIDDLLCLSAALLCEANQAGNVCINLEHFTDTPLFSSSRIDPTRISRVGDATNWSACLRSSRCVGGPGDAAPLILDGKRLYLNRFWHYETQVAEKIKSMLAGVEKSNNAEISYSGKSLYAGDDDTDSEQMFAVTMAASKPFSVVSGGPGTGKTTTIIKILCRLISQQPKIRIALAAPTGKAAARMMESIRNRIDLIEIDDNIRAAIPTRASTLHRLLGYRRRGYKYHHKHRLPVDCVVIDEASMIDLTLMYHLLDALPGQTRVILLGDRDQLASVAAGNVLGDITGHGNDLLQAKAVVVDSIALLRHSYRFDSSTDIGKLAGLINSGQIDETRDLLAETGRGIVWYQDAGDEINPDALAWILNAYQPVLESKSAAAALDAYESTRLLCATNRGPLGVEQLNRLISTRLLSRLGRSEGDLFSGLPIMIVRNHHELGLYNGDTGVLWQDDNDQLQACFRDERGGVREYALNRLPEYSCAWAITVHKSQGSEYGSVLLLLPNDATSPVLSRELLYTAVTRARHRFYLQSCESVVRASIERLTRRHSGLAERLGWQD